MAKIGLIEFGREVRREMAKVTWPTRKETMGTTMVVLVMVMIASSFFLIVDEIIAVSVKTILGLGT